MHDNHKNDSKPLPFLFLTGIVLTLVWGATLATYHTIGSAHGGQHQGFNSAIDVICGWLLTFVLSCIQGAALSTTFCVLIALVRRIIWR